MAENEDLPTGAGVSALESDGLTRELPDTMLVCIVEKRSGKRSLPKGGRELPETLRDNADREWLEEVNSPQEYLSPLIWGDNSYRDDGYLGIRYYFDWHRHPQQCGPRSHPVIDVASRDGVARAHWVTLEQVRTYRFSVPGHVRALSEID